MKIKTGTKFVTATVETSTECNVKEEIKARIEKAIQDEVNLCSKEYYRTIRVEADIFAD